MLLAASPLCSSPAPRRAHRSRACASAGLSRPVVRAQASAVSLRSAPAPAQPRAPRQLLACRVRAPRVAAAAASAPEELAGGLTEEEAVTNIVKAVMGAGVFSLPWAVAQGGLVFVPAFIIAAAFLALHTLAMLVNAKRAIVATRPELTAQVRPGPAWAGARARADAGRRWRPTRASSRRRWARWEGAWRR